MTIKTKLSIYGVTGMLVLYVICANLPLTFGIVFLLFLITSGGLFRMVYSILTDNTNLSGKSFDEYFYEDEDLKK